MRIKRLFVQELFGIFNHEVQLNLSDRITLMYGPNGFGKTTLLRLTSSLFNHRYNDWFRFPLKMAEVGFENGDSLQIRPTTRTVDDRKQRELECRLLVSSTAPRISTVQEFSPKDADFPLAMIEDVLPLMRVAEFRWRNIETGEDLSLSDVVARYGDALPIRAPKRQIDPWLDELTKSVKVRFIESQRLFRQARRPRRVEGRWSHLPDTTVPAVVFYSDRLATEIKNKLTEYAQLSQKLDQTFPIRLVQYLEEKHEQIVAASELEKRLADLDQKRKRLMNAGLLEKEYVAFQMPPSLHGLTQQVLPLYVDDVEHKLKVFDDILAKIELLKEIVNDRFLFKALSTSENGFSLSTKEGRVLVPVNLSSGEQNMLVLLSELLFGIEPNSLILIDEPEISLHVAWQQEFLRDIARVSRLAAVDVLIATHSPQIINENWSLTVELKGPSEPSQ